MQGKRVDGVKPLALVDGEYAVGQTEVWARLPIGEIVRIPTALAAAGPRWELEEHEDGTITLHPSINMHPAGDRPGWHGWLQRGVWTEA